jgi:cell division protease FtsH
MKNTFKSVLFYIIVIIAIIIAVNLVAAEMLSDKDMVYSDIIEMFNKDEVKYFEIKQDGTLLLTRTDDSKLAWRLLDYEGFMNDIEPSLDRYWASKESGSTVTTNLKSFDKNQPTNVPWWVGLLPYVVVIVIFVALWFYMVNQSSKGGSGGGRGGLNPFGRSRAKLSTAEKTNVTFADVAGADEEKAELEEVVEFLRQPDRYTKLGAKIPRGVLLVGPPGTGKTLLAKAVAGEAGVPFYSISGSDFVEMYVGVGASRVRDLFETARKNPASIIFIDEIDAVGRHRGAGLGGGHDEREQTLNQLLVEMDGFGTNEGVIVMAATNRPDILDPALLRPGRFDRQITVNYPDLNGRESVLKVHSKGKPFEESVDLRKVAQTTVGFTGADLANLLNEAALITARKHKQLIGMDEIEQASLKIMVGTPKKSMKIKESERLKTAYHEAGHAILAHLLPTIDPVRQISIVPSGRALGYTLNPPTEDKYNVYKSQLKEEITMLLGGRVAEKIIFDDISGGASNDIQRATATARKMVTRLGMSDRLGSIMYGSEHSSDEIFLGRDFSSDKNYSEETAAAIDEEIKKIVDECYVRAEKLLRENMEKLRFIAEFLVKYETMDDEQFKAAMDNGATELDLAAMVEKRKAKSDEENELRRKREAEEKVREQSTGDSEQSAGDSGQSAGDSGQSAEDNK